RVGVERAAVADRHDTAADAGRCVRAMLGHRHTPDYFTVTAPRRKAIGWVMPPRWHSRRVLVTAMLIASAGLAAQAPLPDNPDKIAAAWVDTTFRKLTLEDKLGQLVFVNASAGYLPSDTNEFDALQQKVKQL